MHVTLKCLPQTIKRCIINRRRWKEIKTDDESSGSDQGCQVLETRRRHMRFRMKPEKANLQ